MRGGWVAVKRAVSAQRNELSLAFQPARDNDEEENCYDYLERPECGKHRVACTGIAFETSSAASHNSQD